MKRIIDPINPSVIESELRSDRFLRNTNKGENEIYIVTAQTSPNVMRELGRLREIAFRDGGGGTGKECDIDEYDVMNPPCQQLLIWNPKDKNILGGYRFILGEDIRFNDGKPRIATSHMFNFSQKFLDEYLPNTMELGRSFVSPEYQSTKAGAKALYTLDNLWDGLGALTVVYPQVKYLFGKVTMYPRYDKQCRNMLLYFMHKHFPDKDELVRPITPLDTEMNEAEMARLFSGNNYNEDYKILHHNIRKCGFNIPPLINAYMNLSPSMRMFGTAINDEFGDVEESGIFITLSDIFEEKKKRHINTYNGNHA
jgi:hypothetical protein